jgi:putative DNA primase/helicase
VADLAGGHWADRARNAAVELSADGEDAASPRVLLLGDLRDLFDRKSAKVQFTHEILDELHKDETRPWPEWRNGKPMTSRHPADLLKPFKIKPQTVRRYAKTDKGYKLESFEAAFARYLPRPSVTTSQMPAICTSNRALAVWTYSCNSGQ